MIGETSVGYFGLASTPEMIRSPSWPVWAPRIPNVSQKSSNQQPARPETSLDSEFPSSSSLMLLDPRNRFWSASSPLSSRERTSITRNSLRSSVAVVAALNDQNEMNQSKNGVGSSNMMSRVNEDVGNDVGLFKVPGPQDVPRHLRKNFERNSFDARNDRNAANLTNDRDDGQQNNVVASTVKPRIGQPGWRSISKTCDCIEKGKISPVLRLADQARAVSSPDPLHRPDNPRASLRSATTAQTLSHFGHFGSSSVENLINFQKATEAVERRWCSFSSSLDGFVNPCRGIGGSHRKLLDGAGGKLATVATSPADSEESSLGVPEVAPPSSQHRNSITPPNPSGGSGLSETGSLDRAKAALERRKKAEDGTGNPILCRVEVTRPNPDSLIDELIKATNLEQTDLESSETTGLQLFIAKDGTTALGSHEIKSQMPAGVFKQVVMEENNRVDSTPKHSADTNVTHTRLERLRVINRYVFQFHSKAPEGIQILKYIKHQGYCP
ncbi:hypothetical protein E2986_11321 [Frieseomelitta varia]|uniref:Uncharacterized protein n=1 Tax=Frieseomelitta varia TaxID=561572 RepID=A0A833REX0_9HYME|nr:hypothetical protein E2986_11321 [Frieseomelitta varia]